MKIVYILHESSLYGGATRSFLSMLKEMVAKGVEPLVIIPQNGELYNELSKDNIKNLIVWYQYQLYPFSGNLSNIKDLILYMPRIIKMMLTNIKAQNKIKRKVKEFAPDLIHTNVGVIHVGYNISKELNIPHIWHIREYQDENSGLVPFPNISNFRNKLRSKHNNCIAISRGIFEFFKMDKNKDIVIYNGVATENDIRFTKEKQDYFLYVGRLEVAKGIEFLLYAYSKLHNDYSLNIPKLLIAGKGTAEYTEKLLKIVQQNNLTDKVEFLGNRNDINDLMYFAKALIVPSFSEGFGRTTAEAIFNGCLTIGFNNTGTKEILSNNNIGLLYDTEQHLINYMKNIIQNGIEQYYPMIKKAQEEALKLYTNEKNAYMIYDFYEKVLNSRNLNK